MLGCSQGSLAQEEAVVPCALEAEGQNLPLQKIVFQGGFSLLASLLIL
jgi:hypothetical protein